MTPVVAISCHRLLAQPRASSITKALRGECDAHWLLHVTDGGVPLLLSLSRDLPVSLSHTHALSHTQMCGTGGAYGRLLASNASVLQYEHVENPTGKVSDRWAITKHHNVAV